MKSRDRAASNCDEAERKHFAGEDGSRAIRELRAPWDNWLPSAEGISGSALALHEYAALYLDYRR